MPKDSCPQTQAEQRAEAHQPQGSTPVIFCLCQRPPAQTAQTLSHCGRLTGHPRAPGTVQGHNGTQVASDKTQLFSGPATPSHSTACFPRTPHIPARTSGPPTATYRDRLAGAQHVLGRELVGDLLPLQDLPLDPPVPQRLVLAQGTPRLMHGSGRAPPAPRRSPGRPSPCPSCSSAARTCPPDRSRRC